MDHLDNILLELQCGRSRDLENIAEHVSSQLDKVDYIGVRKSLRKLGYKQHYLMIPSIMHQIDPKQFPPWVPKRGQVGKIKKYYYKYLDRFGGLPLEAKGGKKNNLNYHFCIQKIAMVLGIKEIVPFLNPPKGKKTIQRHEHIWSLLSIK